MNRLARPARRASPPLAGSRLARALGCASLGLGAPLLIAPGRLLKALAMKDADKDRAVAAFVGVRELVAGVGLLRWPSPAWLWSRVSGDAMDLTLMARALKNHTGQGRERTVAATVAVAAITAVDVYAAITRSRKWIVVELTATTTVRKSPHEVYSFWRQLENLPTFMAHLDNVQTTGERSSTWRASAPFGKKVEWDAEITDDVPGFRIGWRSKENADVDNEGVVRFVPAPGGRGTEVHVRLRYVMPGGKLGVAVARYFGEEPHQQLDDDLRRLKEVLEIGEVIRSPGAPGGRLARHHFPQHPAQPLSRQEFREGAYA